jgi:hypothetical protein
MNTVEFNVRLVMLSEGSRMPKLVIPCGRSRRVSWTGYVARMGEIRNAYTNFVGKPEGKRPLGRPRRGWEDKIRMDLM